MKPPVMSEMVYNHDKEVSYFKVGKGKNKRKINSPKKVEPKSKQPQLQELAQAPKKKEPQNEELAQT